LSITLQALPDTYRFATCWAHKSCWVELLDTLLELKRNFTMIVQSAMIIAPYYLAPLFWRCSSITCKMLSLCPNFEGASHKMEDPSILPLVSSYAVTRRGAWRAWRACMGGGWCGDIKWACASGT